MRCMTAIWPAGPPKLSIATRAQTRKASPRLTPCRIVPFRARTLAAVDKSVMSGPLLPDGPVVSLVRRVAAPTVEGVVEGHSGFKLFEIVGIHPGESERGGQQARRLGREIGTSRVGAAHDGRQPQERLRGEAELLDHPVECTPRAAVAPVNVLIVNVEGGCPELPRDGGHLGGR